MEKTLESNIEKARRLYYRGVEYIPIRSTGEPFDFEDRETIEDDRISEYPSGNIEAGDNGYIYVQESNQWASIIGESKYLKLEKAREVIYGD